jgi:cytochrome c oxidase assembly factor CtaG
MYTGPPALTWTNALTSWTLDLPVLLAVLAAAGLYLAGVWRVRRAGQPWPVSRTVTFLAGGTGALVIATMSFLGVYQGVLFWPRAVQNVLLLLLAPLFLALGRPLSLLIAAAPRPGSWAQAAVRSRAARVLTFPAITALVLVIMPFLLYFTPWYEAGLRSDAVRELTYFALMAPGLVFFWTLLRVDPVPKAYPYLVSLWVTGAEVVGDAVLGLAIIADPHLIAGSYYQALARPWGPSLRADQVIGGGALWILGDLVGLPFLAAQLIQMIKEDEQEAAQVDAELDAKVVRDELSGATAEGRPWWENDPRFTGRFRGPEGG